MQIYTKCDDLKILKNSDSPVTVQWPHRKQGSHTAHGSHKLIKRSESSSSQSLLFIGMYNYLGLHSCAMIR